MRKIIFIVTLTAFAATSAFAQTQANTRTATNAARAKTTTTGAKGSPPEGATALCGDRSYSFKKSKSPCSGRGGVIQLFDDGKSRMR